MAVSSKQGLIDYCLRELGHPLIKINVTEEQIEDRVEEALEHFREYHYDGIEKVYMAHALTQQNLDTKQIQVNDSLIYGVTKVHHYGTALSTNNLFSLEYQLRLEDMYSLMGADLISYETSRQHISMLQHLLVGHKSFRFNRYTSVIHLDQDLDRQFEVGNFILIECYRVLDPSEATSVWGNQWLKHYTTALIKRQWGNNLRKYQGLQLPGGVSIDGNAIYDEANQEVEALRDDLDSKSAPLSFLVG